MLAGLDMLLEITLGIKDLDWNAKVLMVDEVDDADVDFLQLLVKPVNDGKHARSEHSWNTFLHRVIDPGIGLTPSSSHSFCKPASLSAAPPLSMLPI